MEYAQVVAFHGHSCPELATGYVMTKAALEALGEERAPDEELVAVVENDAGGVDALQCLSGCTFGKGNLVFHDYGKHAFTLLSRASGKGVRVTFDWAKIPDGLREDRQRLVNWILSGRAQSCVAVCPVTMTSPGEARMRSSVQCVQCGESVMETRVKQVGGKALCIPCAEAKPTS